MDFCPRLANTAASSGGPASRRHQSRSPLTRDTPETALIILAGHDLASDTMFNVALPSEVAAISVKAGGHVRIPLPMPGLLAAPGMSVEVAVTSATRLTSDRSEQTGLTFTPNPGDD